MKFSVIILTLRHTGYDKSTFCLDNTSSSRHHKVCAKLSANTSRQKDRKYVRFTAILYKTSLMHCQSIDNQSLG